MLEYQTNKRAPEPSREKNNFACAECNISDFRVLHWRVDRWLCENCKAVQKHSLAAETLATASKQLDKSKGALNGRN